VPERLPLPRCRRHRPIPFVIRFFLDLRRQNEHTSRARGNPLNAAWLISCCAIREEKIGVAQLVKASD